MGWEGNVSLAFDFVLLMLKKKIETLLTQTSAVLGHPDGMQRYNALI